MVNNLYYDTGYLNQEYIIKSASGNGCAFIFEIGGRQVGKTYGAIKYALASGQKFAYMRRTQSEVDFLCSVGNPFAEHDDTITVKKAGKYTANIIKDDQSIGVIVALSTIAKIRGFSWHDIKMIIYDEFIPERHVTKIKDEGDAFLNAMITISGNRELAGEPAPLCLLLANPNLHANAITNTFGIVDKLDSMETAGQEISIMRDRGIMIVRPSSAELMEKRSKTAVFRAAGTESKLAQMALGNEFSYDDKTGIGSRNIKEYNAAATISGMITIWKHKSRAEYYITPAFGEAGSVYYQNDPDLERFRNLWSPIVRKLDRERKIIYSSQLVKDQILKAIGKI